MSTDVSHPSTPLPAGAGSRPEEEAKKDHGRRSLEELIKTLPVVRQMHELTDAERLCPDCGQPRNPIGAQTTQEYIPAKLVGA